MNQIYGLENCETYRGGVLTIGNYDGIHLGHKRIIERVVSYALQTSTKSLLMTFDPHPSRVLTPSRAPGMIMTNEQKNYYLKRLRLDGVLYLPFNRTFSTMTADEFIENILVEKLSVSGVVVGDNFHFGYKTEGTMNLLRRRGSEHGFFTEVVKPVLLSGEVISSTRIRKAVVNRQVSLAQQMLGRPYSMIGTVVRGGRRGRGLGLPTVNLEPVHDLIPGDGVYVSAIRRSRDERYLPSITNIGVRPTFDGGKRVIETHILDYDGDLYGESMELRFYDYLRREKQFPDPESLKEQIHSDIKKSRTFFDRF